MSTSSNPQTPETYPRYVTPGIENQIGSRGLSGVGKTLGSEAQKGEPNLPERGVYIGLDWIRCTGHEVLCSSVENLIRESFGGECKVSHGAKWFKHGIVLEPGVLLSWGHRDSICQVDIQGQRLRLMDGATRVDLLRSLMELGMTPTRLDGALDFVGQDVGICVAAKSSCERGELCILRKYSPNDEFTAQGMPTRRLLKLGSRSSPVCARIYDKGLEQGVASCGWYERLEVEWKGDRAPQIAMQLCEAGQAWSGALLLLVLGAIEFREANGRSELKRRPMAKWWADLLCNQKTSRIAPAQQDESFERWLSWFRVSCAPRLLELAQAASMTVGQLVEMLSQGVQPGTTGGPVVSQFASLDIPLK